MTIHFKNKFKNLLIFNFATIFFLGILSSFSLPPYNFFFLNFITFPLLYLIIKKYNDKKIKLFFLGWSFGFGYFISSLYWISYSLKFDDIFKPLIPFSIILLPLILGIFTALATFLMSYFKFKENFSSVLIFALMLSLVDYLRGTILTGFPWNLISYSLVNLIEQIQIISFLGTYLFNLIVIITFLSPLFVVFQSSRANKILSSFIIIFIFVLNYLLGAYIITNSKRAEMRKLDTTIKILSPSIKLERYFQEESINNKINDLFNLMKSEDNQKTLYILPEGILTGIFLDELNNIIKGSSHSISEKHFIIMGINSRENGNIYNSLVVLDNKFNVLHKYNKNKLVPFGEFLPFESFLKKLGLKKITQGYNSFSYSNERKIIYLQDISLLPLICYEIVYSGKLVKDNNNFDAIVNISEDGWFGSSIGPHQHFSKSIFRAIEEGKNIFRSSNNGISAIINPNGMVMKRIESTSSGVITVNNMQISTKTLFSKFGNKIFFYFLIFYISFIFFLKRKDL